MTRISRRPPTTTALQFGVFVSVGLLFALPSSSTADDAQSRNFSADVAFLKQHTDSFTLGSGAGKIVVTPAYQGRVMTSTSGGDEEPSFGWINYDLIQQGVLDAEAAKGALEEHIYVFGGEERFWMGPEGGQFAIFFKPGDPFDFEHWFTPAVIDTEPFQVKSRSADEAVFTRKFNVQNYSGTRFHVAVRRQVRVLDAAALQQQFGIRLPEGVELVGYESDNRMTNIGKQTWTRDGGLLSIWMLGMYKPSSQTTVVIPFKSGGEARLGPAVNDTYFGKVPACKLVVRPDVLFFSGDGTHRSKIGINPQRSQGIAGSYDADGGVLNIVTYNVPADADLPYVNSMWKLQEDPFDGDAINSYNDGPPAPDKEPLGPFYELETSSPAAELAAGKSLTHIQRTYHIKGQAADLDPISHKLLGVTIEQIKTSLSGI